MSGTAGGIGVFGQSDKGVGVWGESQSDNQPGVFGKSTKWQGVSGNSTDQAGVVGVSTNFVGVWGESQSGNQPGVFGHFEGNVEVKGDVTVTGDIKLINADCAEDFNIGADVSIAPGTVMVLGEEGALFPSLGAYDKRVAGVISGAGEYKPGIVLDKQPSDGIRQPVALLGKVYCKVDAQYGAIEVGDLLTTSPTPGYAMKADDPLKAFGAVIGKALRPLAAGQDLIPILIAFAIAATGEIVMPEDGPDPGPTNVDKVAVAAAIAASVQAGVELINAVATLLTSARSVVVEVDNNTGLTLTKIADNHDHGGFAALPHLTIPPHSVDVFGSQSKGGAVATGTEGSVTYASDGLEMLIGWTNAFAFGDNKTNIGANNSGLGGPNANRFLAVR